MEEFDPKEFESISPYSDAEAVEALGKVADHPAVPAISQYLFPKEDPTFLRTALKKGDLYSAHVMYCPFSRIVL